MPLVLKVSGWIGNHRDLGTRGDPSRYTPGQPVAIDLSEIFRESWCPTSRPCTLAAVATEVWCRNPDYYIKECLEVGVQKIVWDRGFLYKKSIEPTRFMDLYYGNLDYRMLVIEAEQTYELRPGFTMANPYCEYPTWSYGDDMAMLEELMEKNLL